MRRDLENDREAVDLAKVLALGRTSATNDGSFDVCFFRTRRDSHASLYHAATSNRLTGGV